MKVSSFQSLLVSFFIALFSLSSFGQAPTIKWHGQYPPDPEPNATYSAEDIVETSDGYVICGYKVVQNGPTESESFVFVMKVSIDGEVEWANDYDVENPVVDYTSSEQALSIAENDAGNFYLVGFQTLPPIPLSPPEPPRPSTQLLIMEIMADGTKGRSFSVDNDDDWSEGRSIHKTINNTFIITGLALKYDAFGHADDRILLGELTENNLEPVFLNSFPYKSTAGNHPGWGVWATSFAGEFSTRYLITGSLIMNKFDLFFMEVDDSGFPYWKSTYGGDESDQLSDVLAVEDNYYLAGYSEDSVDGYTFLFYQAYVVKADNNGDIIWENTYGGPATYFANDIDLAPDGDLVITGTHESWDHKTDIFLMKIDEESGDSIWYKKYDVYGGARRAMLTSDFGYLIAGRSIIASVPQKQIFLMYLDHSVETETVVIPRSAIGLGIVNTSDNIDVVSSGDLLGNLYGVSVTINELLHPQVENLEIYLEHADVSVKLINQYDANGENFISTRFFDAADHPISSGEAPYSASYKPANMLRAFNGVNSKGDWQIRIIDYSTDGLKSTTGTLNGWTLKLLTDAGSGTGIHSPEEIENFLLNQCYPNPAREETRIDFKIPWNGHVNLQVFNLSGQMISKLVDSDLTEGEHTRLWNVRNISAGTYYLHLESNGIIIIQKLIVIK